MYECTQSVNCGEVNKQRSQQSYSQPMQTSNSDTEQTCDNTILPFFADMCTNWAFFGRKVFILRTYLRDLLKKKIVSTGPDPWVTG